MKAGSQIEAIGNTPLVELQRVRPEGGARIFVKWEGANPTGSMKDRMARSMIRGGEADGDLHPGRHVIEFTGGSTGSSLALICAVKGYPLTLLTADCFAEEKIRSMEAFGADVEVLETPDGKVHPGLFDQFHQRLDELAPRLDAYFTDQFNNEHHPAGYHGLGSEIVADCPEVSDFVMGVGTGGCAVGTTAGMRAEGHDVVVTLVELAESPFLTEGKAGSHAIEGVGPGFRPPFLDPDGYDEVIAVPERTARQYARDLARTEGLFAGTSTGMHIAAAVEVASNRDSGEAVVTVAVDTGLKYLHGDLYR